MKLATQSMISVITATLLLSLATQSFAQRSRPLSRDPVLKGNPMRDAGGSCVYSRDGQVVFAPEGKDCPDRTDHLVNTGETDSKLVGSFPPAMRGELSRLLNDHHHIATEVARLRRAIKTKNERDALQAADKISSELTDHTAREERFFEKLADRHSNM